MDVRDFFQGISSFICNKELLLAILAGPSVLFLTEDKSRCAQIFWGPVSSN